LVSNMLFLAATFICLLRLASGLYSKTSSVVELNQNNFDRHIKDSNGVWVVEFYVPGCGHCKQLASEFEKAAKVLQGIISMGGVNCDEHNALCGQFDVKDFPTIKIFGDNKNKPEDYNGARNVDGIVQQAQKTATKIVLDRMGGKLSSSGGGGGGSTNDVIELTESNFKKLVLQSEDMWLVEFFVPWCDHCKNLAPHWTKTASELKGKVKLGTIDSTVHQSLVQQYGVQGYPTIKYFPAGSKSGPEEYDGGHTADDMVAWTLERHTENIAPPEMVQIAGDSMPNCHKIAKYWKKFWFDDVQYFELKIEQLELEMSQLSASYYRLVGIFIVAFVSVLFAARHIYLLLQFRLNNSHQTVTVLTRELDRQEIISHEQADLLQQFIADQPVNVNWNRQIRREEMNVAGHDESIF
jgi:protein disulfide-isomerase-like protein